MKAQMAVFRQVLPGCQQHPACNLWNIKGYHARDAVRYDFYTYMDGVMEKYKPGDYEFDLPQKLIDLYQRKIFGRYGVNGRQPVCFIASNHTTAVIQAARL